MRWLFRIVLAAAVAGVLLWLWTIFFPSPEAVIRKRLTELAQQASFNPSEGEIARPLNAASLAGFFTPDIELALNVREFNQQGTFTREQIVQGALAMRNLVQGLKVEFLDSVVSLESDRQSADVSLTMRASVPGDKNFSVQEMKLRLRKIDGKWYIFRVETVRTLTWLKGNNIQLPTFNIQRSRMLAA